MKKFIAREWIKLLVFGLLFLMVWSLLEYNGESYADEDAFYLSGLLYLIYQIFCITKWSATQLRDKTD